MRKHIIEELRNELFVAIDKLNFEEVKRCVVKAREKHVKNEIINGKQYGMAPIHFATYRASSKILQFLINNGADINAVRDECLVPLTFTIVKHNIPKVIFSCIHGDTSFQGIQNFTALHLALYQCRLDVAKVLVENGIDTSIRSTNGKTAFEIIPGYESLCSDDCDMSKIYLDLSKFHKNNCTELLLSARVNTKVELEAGNTPDAASSTASPSSASIRASIKIGLEVSSTEDPSSSTVNSFFTPTRADFKEASSITSGSVKPSSFINSVFSWMGTSTTAALSSLFQSAPALPPAQQSVDHFAGSPIASSQVDFNGTVLLTAIAISKFTGKRYSRPLDDSLLTLEQIRERKVSAIERDIKMVISEFEKLDQCPRSLLSNSTISKGVCHQKSL
ncbi:MAG: ankyrin repeat domain-containing protein [Wolbachia sp.]